jgi:hypothetical protein
MKVVSGSLDVLETVGKKTFDVCIRKNSFLFKYHDFYSKVINEADPDLKGTRRLLNKQNRPTLSEVCSYIYILEFYSIN